MKFTGIFNRDGGTFKTTDLDAFSANAIEVFARHGHDLECRQVAGRELISALEDAAESSTDVILAGGGDGTVSAAAAAAFHSGKALAVLPAGTMNLFARMLNMPLDLTAALEAIATSDVRPVDIATVNGRPFVHQFSVGLHTRLVRMRETMVYRGRVGKIVASVRAFASAMARPPRFRVDVETIHGVEKLRCSAVIVSNGPLPDAGLPDGRDRLHGMLGFYATRMLTAAETLKLGFGMVTGSWKESPLVIARECPAIELHFPLRKSTAQAAIDGELVPLDEHVQFRSHPGALKVVAPAQAAAQP